MSNDTAECGCEGHASNLEDCLYPALKLEVESLRAQLAVTEKSKRVLASLLYDSTKEGLLASQLAAVQEENVQWQGEHTALKMQYGDLAVSLAASEAARAQIREALQLVTPAPGFPKCVRNCASNVAAYDEDPRCDCGFEEIRVYAEQARAALEADRKLGT